MKCKAFSKGISVLLVMFGAVFVSAEPQAWTDGVQVYSYGSIGYCDLNIQSLNKTMANLKLSPFASKPLQVELGSQLFVEHLVLESSLGGLLFDPRKADNQKATLLGGYGQLALGMNIIGEGSSWKLFPFFGVGAQVFRFAYHEDAAKFGAQASVKDPQVYWMPTFFTSYGCTIQKSFRIEGSKDLFTIGVRGGVYVDPTIQSTWYNRGVRYQSGPTPQFSGPFLQVIIGSGSFIPG